MFLINFSLFLDTLPMMLFGMGGIFLIIGLVALCIYALNWFGKGKGEEKLNGK